MTGGTGRIRDDRPPGLAAAVGLFLGGGVLGAVVCWGLVWCDPVLELVFPWFRGWVIGRTLVVVGMIWWVVSSWRRRQKGTAVLSAGVASGYLVMLAFLVLIVISYGAGTAGWYD